MHHVLGMLALWFRAAIRFWKRYAVPTRAFGLKELRSLRFSLDCLQINQNLRRVQDERLINAITTKTAPLKGRFLLSTWIQCMCG